MRDVLPALAVALIAIALALTFFLWSPDPAVVVVPDVQTAPEPKKPPVTRPRSPSNPAPSSEDATPPKPKTASSQVTGADLLERILSRTQPGAKLTDRESERVKTFLGTAPGRKALAHGIGNAVRSWAKSRAEDLQFDAGSLEEELRSSDSVSFHLAEGKLARVVTNPFSGDGREVEVELSENDQPLSSLLPFLESAGNDSFSLDGDEENDPSTIVILERDENGVRCTLKSI
ncbi:MAG: hypothetical protein AAF517_24910 [Planctomycetota bacterium]